jgi:hypothetical protein
MKRIKILIGVPDELKMEYSFNLNNTGYSSIDSGYSTIDSLVHNVNIYAFFNNIAEIASINLDKHPRPQDIEILIFDKPFHLLVKNGVGKNGIINLNDQKTQEAFDNFIGTLISQKSNLDSNQIWYKDFGKSLKESINKKGGSFKIFLFKGRTDFNHYINYLESFNRVSKFAEELFDIMGIEIDKSPIGDFDKVFKKIYDYDGEIQDILQWLKCKEFKYS